MSLLRRCPPPRRLGQIGLHLVRMQAPCWQCLFTIRRSVPRLERRGVWRSDAMKLDILRRKIAVAVLMLGPLAALAPVPPTRAAAAVNPIVTANQPPGTD